MADVSFLFGGTDADPLGSGLIDFADYGVMVTDDESPLMVPISTEVQPTAYSPVANAWGPMYQPRYIRLGCKLIGTSQANRQSKIDSILPLLLTNSDRSLKLDHLSDRFFMARLYDIETPLWIGSGAVRFTLVFLCRDGRAYSTTEKALTFNISGTGGTFTVEDDSPATAVGGSAIVHPQWVIKNTAGMAALTLVNTTRNETFIYSRTCVSTDWVKLLSRPDVMRCYLSTDSGANYAASMGIVGVFPILSPGVQNVFTVDGFTANGQVICTYRERYL